MTCPRAAAIAMLLLLGSVSTAPAQSAQASTGCGSEACDRKLLEEAEGQLQRAIDEKIAELARRTTIQSRIEQAKADLLEAQRQWQQFRAAECKARVAANVISARTREGLTLECLAQMTQERVRQIREEH